MGQNVGKTHTLLLILRVRKSSETISRHKEFTYSKFLLNKNGYKLNYFCKTLKLLRKQFLSYLKSSSHQNVENVISMKNITIIIVSCSPCNHIIAAKHLMKPKTKKASKVLIIPLL